MKRSIKLLLPSVVASAVFCLSSTASDAAGRDRSGVASWYGEWHDGRRTSSGAVFDQNAMTAASPSIPLGSRVRVTLHRTGRSVVVLVNDRQSPRGGRILDLSRGAAQRIGMIGMGRGVVTVAPADDTVEVAEARGNDVNEFDVSRAPRGRPHTRRGGRSASAGHPSSP